MKPDRFEEMVAHLVDRTCEPESDHMNAHLCLGGAIAYTLPCAVCESGIPALTSVQVIALLRKQHAQVVWTVKMVQGTDAHCWIGGQVALVTGPGKGNWVKRTTLLKALARLKKGQP